MFWIVPVGTHKLGVITILTIPAVELHSEQAGSDWVYGGVLKGGYPKWMVYNGKYDKNG